MSFKTDCNTQSFVYFYSIHPVVIYKNKKVAVHFKNGQVIEI
ncbi:hypothetical protein MGAS9429_Spy0460 [Streptococcus pyogenes MGAS9429]|uniref:Uncharacterized protein n=1 Tax=Streptococcus pyogenes serotype M12 (strain MGAS9429) TaxID=370551 RepID=Q1JMV0_STRPC|nr:hypothetical protein MGAS9429_Spy0460 [Streptococcus pyogenes MGAS9429]ABF35533.1 hypothetical protein MGAS2096_Spy0480 [Streptococcus pyogenes MGAS2096]